MLLLTYANWENCFSRMSVPRRAQWSKKVRALQQMTVSMARGHGLKKGLVMYNMMPFSVHLGNYIDGF